MNTIGIHQLLPSLEQEDAIGNYARGLQSFIQKLGHSSEIFVYDLKPGQNECFSYHQHHRFSSPKAILLFHTSIGSPLARYFAEVPDRKILIHHNITPAKFFANYEPDDAWLAITARRQLAELAQKVEATAADSEFNAEELRALGYPEPEVIPLLFDWDSLAGPTDQALRSRLDDGKTNIIFVGRVAPNKRQDELIRVFDRYRELFNPKSRLILIGDKKHFPAYTSQLENMISTRGLEKQVELTGKVSDRELRTYYRQARAFLCLSRHEGFGVPLVESLFYQLPVLARDAGAVASTLGEAGLVINTSEPNRLAALLDQLVQETELRRQVLEAQGRRLSYYRNFPFQTAWKDILFPLKT